MPNLIDFCITYGSKRRQSSENLKFIHTLTKILNPGYPIPPSFLYTYMLQVATLRYRMQKKNKV